MKQLKVNEMAGVIMLLLQKNKYCFNQVEAVLEIVQKRSAHYMKTEPISFCDHAGSAREITACRKCNLCKLISALPK